MQIYRRNLGGRHEPIATQDIKRASVGPQGEVILWLDTGLHETHVVLRSDEVSEICKLSREGQS